MGNDILDSATTAEFPTSKPTSEPVSAPVKARILGGLIVGVIMALSILTLAWSMWHPADNAYTQAVLRLSGNPIQGRSMFVMNCVACHGQWADGKVGPSLRNVSERLSPRQIVHQVVSGDTPPMPQFQPAPQEMADLLSYLQQL